MATKRPDNQVYLDALTRQEACQLIKQRWNPTPRVQEHALTPQLKGRVLARDVCTTFDFPTCPTSHMDGIAVRFDDFAQGMPNTRAWKRGIDFERADTGDPVPDGFDTVVIVEYLRFDDGSTAALSTTHSIDDPFVIDAKPEYRGENVSPIGKDFRAGDRLLTAHTRLTAQHLGACAASGISHVEVYEPPHIALIPTGDELVEPGHAPSAGKTIDSNSIMISALIEEAGGIAHPYPITPDSHDQLANALTDALNHHDIVVINAGSSKGGMDCAPQLLSHMGEVLFHWTMTGPGRPVLAALIDTKLVILVPGPPLAADTVTTWLIKDMIAHWYGILQTPYTIVKARAGDDLMPRDSIVEVWRRVYLERDESGELIAKRVKGAPAHQLAKAHGITRNEPGQPVLTGDTVDVLVQDMDGIAALLNPTCSFHETL